MSEIIQILVSCCSCLHSSIDMAQLNFELMGLIPRSTIYELFYV